MTHQSQQYTQIHHGPYYLWTLQTLFWELFQSISSRPHTSPQFTFFPIVRHTSMKIQIILEKAHSCSQQQPTLYISAQHAY